MSTVGAVVGKVVQVRPHPRGDLVWLASVDMGSNADPIQIVFGGYRKLKPDDLVPVAPPGARVTERRPDATLQYKKVRVRTYRGERSHGMLCSFVELGWAKDGRDEVAILRDLPVGKSLDAILEETERQRFAASPLTPSRKSVVLLYVLRRQMRLTLGAIKTRNRRTARTTGELSPTSAPGCS